MSEVRLELPDDVVDAAAMEADLLDFESVTAYFRWVLENRLSLSVDTGRGRALAAYADRFADDGARSAGAAAGSTVVSPGSRPGPDGPDESERDGAREHRIEDAAVETAAAALSSVETDRADVIAQRAVATTRKRLGDVGTGIDYRSTASLEGNKRPGADITDLDEIEVPGWDEAEIERRRDTVGAALAYLSDVEEATRSEFVEALYADYPAGYDSASSWWECVKRGLRQVDRVIPATADSRVWRFRSTPGRVTRISFGRGDGFDGGR